MKHSLKFRSTLYERQTQTESDKPNAFRFKYSAKAAKHRSARFMIKENRMKDSCKQN